MTSATQEGGKTQQVSVSITATAPWALQGSGCISGAGGGVYGQVSMCFLPVPLAYDVIFQGVITG